MTINQIRISYINDSENINDLIINIQFIIIHDSIKFFKMLFMNFM